MKLEDIGFYTLDDYRCQHASMTSALWRCEMILTDRCNFSCPYCRKLSENIRGDLPPYNAWRTLGYWFRNNLQNVRFSGGEPTLRLGLVAKMAEACRMHACKHVAVSTNGSADTEDYRVLLDAGVNDFSISLDACCTSTAKVMSGRKAKFEKIVRNIRFLARRTYVTVGVVLTEKNMPELKGIIEFAHGLGVADIRIIPAAQKGATLPPPDISQEILDAHPILRYRIHNLKSGKPIRGLLKHSASRCRLVLDDMAVAGKYHYPCIIYMREHGDPIGEVGPNMRKERAAWSIMHNTQADPICRNNCLDVCVDYNNR